jgi:RNA polymerase sigma-70 factor, ECF subfamily
MEDETEAGLLARAAKGETEAFLRLYEAHHAALFRFAYRLTSAVDIAEDLTQECFLRVVRQPKFDRARGSLRQYLYGVIRNLVRQRYRALGREVDWSDEAGDIAESTILSATDVMASAQLASEVEAAIFRLPPLQREALVLCEFEDLSLDQAAAVLGTDVGTVKSRLHRAREGLRRQLAAYRKYIRVQQKTGGL